MNSPRIEIGTRIFARIDEVHHGVVAVIGQDGENYLLAGTDHDARPVPGAVCLMEFRAHEGVGGGHWVISHVFDN